MFEKEFFKHLTGLESSLRGNEFFYRAINNTLKISDFEYKNRNTTYYKLDNLIRSMSINTSARMIGDFINDRKFLSLNKVAGTTKLAIGFDENKHINYPKTLLVGDIREIITKKPNKIIAILCKTISNNKYKEITYINANTLVDRLCKDKLLTEKLDIENLHSNNLYISSKISDFLTKFNK
jgi:hypothetical protein